MSLSHIYNWVITPVTHQLLSIHPARGKRHGRPGAKMCMSTDGPGEKIVTTKALQIEKQKAEISMGV